MELGSYEAVHLPTSTAEIKGEWSYTSCPLYLVMECTGTTYLSLLSTNMTSV